MTSTTYEFASAEWRAFMHGVIATRLAALDDEAEPIDWSFCEVFTNAPEHLRTDGDAAVWSCAVQSGKLTFGSTRLPDASLTVEADYATIAPLARYDTLGEPERAAKLAEMTHAMMAEGNMSVSGDPTKLDPRLGSFHDAVAAVTA